MLSSQAMFTFFAMRPFSCSRSIREMDNLRQAAAEAPPPDQSSALAGEGSE